MQATKKRIAVRELALAGLISAAFMSGGALAQESAKTKIEHKSIDRAVAGQRIDVSARVTDPAGVDTVRTYFRAKDGTHYSFIAMQAASGNDYQGTLPAPANGAEWIDYLILVKNGADQVVKSQTFRMQVRDSEQATTYSEPVRVHTELARAPETVTGFSDNIVVDVVESAVKFGVVAGIVDAAGAGTAAGAAGGGAVSAGTVAASAGGLGMGAVVGGLALAGGAAAAGGGGGGGGGGGSGGGSGGSGGSGGGITDGEVRFTLRWSTTADLDLYVTDPCGNTISFRDRTATCQGRTGTLDVDANAGGSPLTSNPVENIVWPSGAPTGTYRVGVNNFNTSNLTTFNLTAKLGDVQQSRSGSVRQGGPDATYEFTYGGGGGEGGGSSLSSQIVGPWGGVSAVEALSGSVAGSRCEWNVSASLNANGTFTISQQLRREDIPGVCTSGQASGNWSLSGSRISFTVTSTTAGVFGGGTSFSANITDPNRITVVDSFIEAGISGRRTMDLTKR